MTQDNWISIEDGTPKSDDDVLVFTLDGRIAMGEFTNRKWKVYQSPYYRIPGRVTHWQPIPPPPSNAKLI